MRYKNSGRSGNRTRKHLWKMHPNIIGRHSVGSTAYLTIIMRSGFSAPFKTCVCCIIECGISDCHLVCLYLAQGVVCPPPCCGLPMYALSRMTLLDPRRFLPTDVYVNMSMISCCSGRWWIRTTAPAKSYDARCPFTGLYLPNMSWFRCLGFYCENQRTSQRAGFIRSIKLLIG